MSEHMKPQSGIEVRFRGGGFAPKSRRWVGPLVFVVLIALMEWGTRSGWISALTLPRPSDVLATFQDLWSTGMLFKHLAPSLTRLAVGAAIGASASAGYTAPVDDNDDDPEHNAKTSKGCLGLNAQALFVEFGETLSLAAQG